MTLVELTRETAATVASLRPLTDEMRSWWERTHDIARDGAVTWSDVTSLAGRDDGYVLTLRVDGRPIGYLLAQLLWDPNPGVHLVMVHHLWVRRAHRGKTRPWWPMVLAFLESWAREKHAWGLSALADPRWSTTLQQLGWQYRGSFTNRDYVVFPIGRQKGH